MTHDEYIERRAEITEQAFMDIHSGNGDWDNVSFTHELIDKLVLDVIGVDIEWNEHDPRIPSEDYMREKMYRMGNRERGEAQRKIVREE